MIVVDIEASGVDYHKHSIVSIGALEFEKPDNRFYGECRIWEAADVRGTSAGLVETFCEHCGAKCPTNGQPQLRAHIMDEALAVCGFTREQIIDTKKQTEAELVGHFLAWVEGCSEHTLAGQNVSFDRDFLKAASERAHLNWPLAYRTIDTHTLAYMHHIKRGKSIPTSHQRSALDLDAILNYTGIPSEPMPHNALTGALSHAEVISRLLYDKKLLSEFKKYDIPWIS